MAAQLQALLGWNTYLLFSSHIVNFVCETDEGANGSRKDYFVEFSSLGVL